MRFMAQGIKLQAGPYKKCPEELFLTCRSIAYRLNGNSVTRLLTPLVNPDVELFAPVYSRLHSVFACSSENVLAIRLLGTLHIHTDDYGRWFCFMVSMARYKVASNFFFFCGDHMEKVSPEHSICCLCIQAS